MMKRPVHQSEKMLDSKIVIYVLAGVFSLSLISGIINNVKDYLKEPSFTKEAVELIIKHEALKKTNQDLLLEIENYKKAYERIEQDISLDSNIIFNSDREYRDSLRRVIFNR